MGRDNDLEGKVFALTGGASGIGLATAQILHARGASLGIADIDPSALERATAVFNKENSNADRVQVTRVDVTKRSEVDHWIQTLVENFGKLDGAANCAGVIGKHHGVTTVAEIDDEQWDFILAVNLTGMKNALRAELGAMTGPGSIVCISSIIGTQGFAKHAAYAASKHGVLGLMKVAAKEAGEREIRVNAITPGNVATPLMDKRNAIPELKPAVVTTPIERMAEPSEVGNLIAFLLSDDAKFISGATYAIDGAWAC